MDFELFGILPKPGKFDVQPVTTASVSLSEIFKNIQIINHQIQLMLHEYHHHINLQLSQLPPFPQPHHHR